MCSNSGLLTIQRDAYCYDDLECLPIKADRPDISKKRNNRDTNGKLVSERNVRVLL